MATKATNTQPGKPRANKHSAAPATNQVLHELKALAKELNKAAKGLSKRNASDPKAISEILGNVERMMSDAADKSLAEAEAAKQILVNLNRDLGADWSRQGIETGITLVGGHLTNIIVAQEFQDIGGQALRRAMKALVGAIVVETKTTEDRRLSQNEVDSLLKELMP